MVYLPALSPRKCLSWVSAAHGHHAAFRHLMFTSSVFFVNLHENECVFHLTDGREVNLGFSGWLER